jgi:predicted GTPase
LRMAEEISRRYRVILETHVPFIEDFSLSLLKQGYDKQEIVKSGFNKATWLWNIYRLVRIASPLTAVISEFRGQAINKLLSHVNAELQIKLKQALLQEVVSVAIDLYSGRFKVDDEGLGSSQSSQEDNNRRAAPLDPLRVCLVGQVSSGKSSVVNALTKRMVAEVNTLPSTDKVIVHECSFEGMDTLNLVDLPGFDGDKSTDKKLQKEVVNCDLVIWILKANQPARELDTGFKTLLDGYYEKEENRSRKRPIVVGVLNQVDRLSPVTEWHPPYELLAPQSEKGRTIKEAVDYNRELFDFETLLPLSVSEEKAFFNLGVLESLLDKHYNDGIQAQLNRRRNEAADNFELTDQAKRIYQSGKSLFNIMKKSSG